MKTELLIWLLIVALCPVVIAKEIYRTQTIVVTLQEAPPDERVGGVPRPVWRYLHIVQKTSSQYEQEATIGIADWELVGTERTNLDDDPEDELVVVSRGGGTGPYYYMQIIDFTKSGFAITSAYSFGKPEINVKVIHLGFGEYIGADSEPEYRMFRYSAGAVLPLKEEAKPETVQQPTQRDK
jgi:hypothetical protein